MPIGPPSTFTRAFATALTTHCQTAGLTQRQIAERIAREQFRQRGSRYDRPTDAELIKATEQWAKTISRWKNGDALPRDPGDLLLVLGVVHPEGTAKDWIRRWNQARKRTDFAVGTSEEPAPPQPRKLIVDETPADTTPAVSVSANSGAVGTFNALIPVNGRPPIIWPHRIGIVPAPVDCRQDRRADHVLAACLAGEDGAPVLSGMGGVGKTQIASVYAHYSWDTGAVDLLVWVTATSRDAILTSYAQAAADATGIEDPNTTIGAARFLAWLAEPHGRRWLIVLDDLQHPADLNQLWPPTVPTGRTLVTTRRRDHALTAGRQLIPVDVFTPQQSAAYLADKLDHDPGRLTQANDLAEDLGHLPLALAQAATYVMDQGLSCAGYRTRLTDRRRTLADLAPETGALPDEHRSTITATWALSIETADTLRPVGLARPILELAALLDPNGIPSLVFTAAKIIDFCATRAGRSVGSDDVQDAIRLLHRFNLVTVDDTIRRIVRVHSLVQRVVREATHPHDKQALVSAVIDALSDLYHAGWAGDHTLRELQVEANFRALLATDEPHIPVKLASMDPTSAAKLLYVSDWDAMEGLRTRMDPKDADAIEWAMIFLPEGGGGP
ncbi:NB-ARC domain-containing protein [Streptomyces sp. NPDC088794]|uniref:NB-ARC domain-containing protein n=1 Tax=Streptomyces sp. NPDC088794 TaxID=3365902 RepID=UPI003815AC0B